jgi:hypothetical protein
LKLIKILKKKKTTAKIRDKTDQGHSEVEKALQIQVKLVKKEEPGMNLEEGIEATEEITKRTIIEETTRTMKEMQRTKVKIMRESNAVAIEEETKEVDMTAEVVIKNQEVNLEKETTRLDTAVVKIEVTIEVVNVVDIVETIEEDKITEAVTTKVVALATTKVRERLVLEIHLEDKAETTDTVVSNNLNKKYLRWPLMALR